MRVEHRAGAVAGDTVVKRERKVTYAITSVPPQQADAARLAQH